MHGLRTLLSLLSAAAVLLAAASCPAQQASSVRKALGAVLDLAIGFQARGGGAAPLTRLRLDPVEMVEVAQAFLAAEDVMRKSGERRRAYLDGLRAQGIEEEPMSEAGVVLEIEVMNNRFAFDRYGCLSFDDRFVKPEERPALDRIAAMYRRLHARWVRARRRGGDAASARPSRGARAPAAAPRMAAGTSRGDVMSNRIDVISNRIEEWHVRRVPVFKGFEDDRYQEHDALIVRCVDEFNRNRAAWAGATPAQGRKIPALTTALVKSHMIEESGGRDPRSLAAWETDPMQVNVPGDWGAVKEDVGLAKPKRRNEGTAEQNIRAAIKFLVRKGFGSSGRRAGARPDGVFDGWQTALRRYNGRNGDLVGGRGYSEVYAEHIVERARNPDSFVAIRKRLDAKAPGGHGGRKKGD